MIFGVNIFSYEQSTICELWVLLVHFKERIFDPIIYFNIVYTMRVLWKKLTKGAHVSPWWKTRTSWEMGLCGSFSEPVHTIFHEEAFDRNCFLSRLNLMLIWTGLIGRPITFEDIIYFVIKVRRHNKT